MRAPTRTAQAVSPPLDSDFDAEHCFPSQFQLFYLAFLLLYLIYNKPLNVSKEKYITQKPHLSKQSEQSLR